MSLGGERLNWNRQDCPRQALNHDETTDGAGWTGDGVGCADRVDGDGNGTGAGKYPPIG